MKRFFIAILLLLEITILQGQIKSEIQLGGSNFVGMSFNTAIDIPWNTLTFGGRKYLVLFFFRFISI